MGRLILLLLVVAGVVAYFTRPDEAKLREAADAVLSDPQNIQQGIESVGAAIAGNRMYDNYYLVSRYTVSFDSNAIVTCWGAFTQVKCDRAQPSSSTCCGCCCF
jgi:hypothetical protein